MTCLLDHYNTNVAVGNTNSSGEYLSITSQTNIPDRLRMVGVAVAGSVKKTRKGMPNDGFKFTILAKKLGL